MNWNHLLTRHHHSLIGALVGLVVAILLILIGFWKTVLLVSLTVIGSFVANYLHKTQLLKRLLNK